MGLDVRPAGSDTGRKEGGTDATSGRPDVPAGAKPRPMRWGLEPGGPKDLVGALGGTGETDVWCDGGQNNALHSTGDCKWTRQRTSLGITPGVVIWGSGPNDIYAIAGGAVARGMMGNGKCSR